MSTHTQNLVTIPQEVYFSRIHSRNCASQMFSRLRSSGFFQRVTAEVPETDFHAKHVKRPGSAQGCGLSG